MPRRLEDGVAQPLPHRPPQGQARHAVDGLGRDRARGRAGLRRRPTRPRLRADGGDGELVAAVERRQVDGASCAARSHDALHRRARPHGLRPAHRRPAARAAPASQDDAADGAGAVALLRDRGRARPGGSRRRQGGGRARAHADAGAQVPRDARCAQGVRRRARDARRRRLHRGVRDPAPAARCASRLDLGGHQQHRRARRGGARGRPPSAEAALAADLHARLDEATRCPTPTGTGCARGRSRRSASPAPSARSGAARPMRAAPPRALSRGERGDARVGRRRIDEAAATRADSCCRGWCSTIGSRARPAAPAAGAAEAQGGHARARRPPGLDGRRPPRSRWSRASRDGGRTARRRA